jgi:16S rRNA (guanine966-N2)-methyltransferase
VSRVIGGVAGGRRLVVPAGPGTRPTADRAREGLFSTLTSLLGALAGVAFLDLFAGAGAVGLEAASRGAGPVVLVERDRQALRALQANVGALALPGITVRAEPVERVLAGTPPNGFDVVFLDPPYADPVDAVLDRVVVGGWLSAGGVLAVERAWRGAAPVWPAGIEALRSRRYGQAALWYGRRP